MEIVHGEADQCSQWQHRRIWQPDYFDRFMRDEDHLYRTIDYIEMNPVRAGLARRSEDWPFGSARLRLEDAGGTPAVRKIMFSETAGVSLAKD